jgi:hypothetical protein
MSRRKKKHPCRRNAFAFLSVASLLSGFVLILIALITGSASLIIWIQVVAAFVLSTLFFLAWRFLGPPRRERGNRASKWREHATITIPGLGALASLIGTLLTGIALLTGTPSGNDALLPCQDSGGGAAPASRST